MSEGLEPTIDPVAALLNGESSDTFREPFASCVLGLEELMSAIGSAAPDDDVLASHVISLAREIHNLLGEPVSVIGMSGRMVNYFPLGRSVYPSELSSLGAIARNEAKRIRAQGWEMPSDDVLKVASRLQQWLTVVIPNAIGQLRAPQMQLQVNVKLSPPLAEIAGDERRQARFRQLEDQAEAAVQNLKTAAGEGGKERLAQTFAVLSGDEHKRAAHWNWLVMVFVALGIVLPLVATWAEYRYLGHLPGLYSGIAKALISLPMFGLATYCGRISAQHRRLDQHMKVLVAQIDSVKAYVADLSEDVQQDVITALGRRAFSEPGIGDPREGTVGVPPEDIARIPEQAVEAIKAARK